MNREKKLLKNTIIITIGKVCTQLITFFLLPLYTGILSAKEYGTIDLINTVISLLLPIITFQVEQAIFRELIEVRKDDVKKEKIITSGIITVFFQCIGYIIICGILLPHINNDYKIFLVINVIIYIFISLFQQIARGLGENTKFAIGSFVSAISTITFNVIFLVFLKMGAIGMLLGSFLGQTIGVMYYLIYLKIYKYIKPSLYSKQVLLKLWKYSIPLIPNAISWWIFNTSDRLIVSTILGVDQNGILSASLKFSAIIITLYNIFNMSWTESISIAINDKDIQSYFNKMLNRILKLFISISIGLISCMPFLFPLMIGKNFFSGYGLVPISIIGCVFNVLVGLISVIYVAKKNTKAIASTSIVSAILNIIIHLSLVRYIGLYAAVISTFVSYFVMSIYRIIDIRKKYLKISIKKELIISSLVIYIIICSCFYINNNILNLFSLLLSIFFALIINKDSIGVLYRLVKTKNSNNQLKL